METREIKISLETATRWHNGTDKELKELAVQTYPELGKKQLPKSWEELEKNRNIFATENQAKSHAIAAAQLSQLMAVYNDGWVADWSDDNQKKSTIVYANTKLVVANSKIFKEFLAFKTPELAEEFLENFRNDIETYFNF
jgi:hypothetical protein